jgi:hypothetical protein
MNSWSGRLHCIAVIASFISAGCLSSGPEDSVGEPDLEQFTQCRWAYSDGTPLACLGTAESLDDPQNRGPEWVCRARVEAGASYFEMVQSALTGHYGIDFSAETGTEVEGVLRLTADGEELLYNWSGTGQAGFFSLGRSLPATTSLEALLGYVDWDTNHPYLTNATRSSAWSNRGGNVSIVHHVHAADATYLFHRAARLPFSGDWSGTAPFNETIGEHHVRFAIKPVVSATGLMLSQQSHTCLSGLS